MVSIILPTYNRAKLLPESIRSVLEQTYTDFELLVVDDGSQDNTQELVQAMPDPRIKYFRLPHTGHTSQMKNFAIGRACGEYLAFIDSDDLWKPEKLEKQVRLLEDNPSIGFSITDATTFKGEEILIPHTYHVQGGSRCVNVFTWMKESRFIIYIPTLVIRRACLEKTGGFDESYLSGDYHFNMRLAYHYDAGILYEPLILRRVHDSNMSEQIPFQNYTEYIDTFRYLYKERMIEKKWYRNAIGNAYWKVGKLHAAGGNRKEARRQLFAALKNNPFRLRYVLSMLKALSGR